MRDLDEIKRINAQPQVTDRGLYNRRVRNAFRDSFLGALPVWAKRLLLEYVNNIPTREGR